MIPTPREVTTLTVQPPAPSSQNDGQSSAISGTGLAAGTRRRYTVDAQRREQFIDLYGLSTAS